MCSLEMGSWRVGLQGTLMSACFYWVAGGCLIRHVDKATVISLREWELEVGRLIGVRCQVRV